MSTTNHNTQSTRTRGQNEMLEGLRTILRTARDHCELAYENPTIYGLSYRQIQELLELRSQLSTGIQATHVA